MNTTALTAVMHQARTAIRMLLTAVIPKTVLTAATHQARTLPTAAIAPTARTVLTATRLVLFGKYANGILSTTEI